MWKLTSPIVTKCPPRKRAESETTALTWTVPKPQCACLNPTETWSKVAWKNFQIFVSLNRQDRKREWEGKKMREGEKQQQAGLNELNPFRGQQSSLYKCLWLVLTLRHSPGQEWGKLPKWKVKSPVWDVIRSRLFFYFFVSVFSPSFSRWSLYGAVVASIFPFNVNNKQEQKSIPSPNRPFSQDKFWHVTVGKSQV